MKCQSNSVVIFCIIVCWVESISSKAAKGTPGRNETLQSLKSIAAKEINGSITKEMRNMNSKLNEQQVRPMERMGILTDSRSYKNYRELQKPLTKGNSTVENETLNIKATVNDTWHNNFTAQVRVENEKLETILAENYTKIGAWDGSKAWFYPETMNKTANDFNEFLRNVHKLMHMSSNDSIFNNGEVPNESHHVNQEEQRLADNTDDSDGENNTAHLDTTNANKHLPDKLKEIFRHVNPSLSRSPYAPRKTNNFYPFTKDELVYYPPESIYKRFLNRERNVEFNKYKSETKETVSKGSPPTINSYTWQEPKEDMFERTLESRYEILNRRPITHPHQPNRRKMATNVPSSVRYQPVHRNDERFRSDSRLLRYYYYPSLNMRHAYYPKRAFYMVSNRRTGPEFPVLWYRYKKPYEKIPFMDSSNRKNENLSTNSNSKLKLANNELTEADKSIPANGNPHTSGTWWNSGLKTWIHTRNNITRYFEGTSNNANFTNMKTLFCDENPKGGTDRSQCTNAA